MELHFAHGVGEFAVLHKLLPDEAGAEVLGHQYADALVNAQNVRRIPVGFGVEGVHEAVARPDPVTVFLAHMQQNVRALSGKKGQRPGAGARDDGSVQSADGWGAAPYAVSFAGVRSGDAPEVLINPGELAPDDHAPELVDAGGGNGVGEVVGVQVALIAIVTPGVRVLVNKERSKSADVVDTAELHQRALERIPGLCRNGMRGRADGQQIHGHQLGVDVPAVLEEAEVWQPAHGKRCAAVEHPWPVNAAVEGGGQRFDARIALKILPAGEHAAEKQSGVNGGKLAAKHTLAAFHVNKVVEKAVLVRALFEQKGQRFFDALFALQLRQIVTL